MLATAAVVNVRCYGSKFVAQMSRIFFAARCAAERENAIASRKSQAYCMMLMNLAAVTSSPLNQGFKSI